MRFTLTIDLGNDAMQTPADVLAAIGRSINYPQNGTLGVGESEAIRDANGNTVGEWNVTDADAEHEPDTGRCAICGEWLDSRGDCGNGHRASVIIGIADGSVTGLTAEGFALPPNVQIIARDYDHGNEPDERGDLYEDTQVL